MYVYAFIRHYYACGCVADSASGLERELDSMKVVLAYSGGLDTACILKTLIDRGHEVVAYIADVGQKEDFGDIAERARKTGASDVFVEDLRREFVTNFIFPSIAGNAVYENRYLLGTALARPVIAKRQVEIALEVGAAAVAHGATGKGNDQVRFELAFAALAPRLGVIAPWKEREFLERFQGRTDLLAFAREHAIPVEATAEKPFSSDENLMHRSYEAGVLEDPDTSPAEDMFKLTRSPREAPESSTQLAISFKDAIPIKVENIDNGTVHTEPVELFEYLNQEGGIAGIGRIDMVENRFVGIKSRGGLRNSRRQHLAPRSSRSGGNGNGPGGAPPARYALASLRGTHLQRILVLSRNGLRPSRFSAIREAD